MTDELRRDNLGCYGNPYSITPNINKLAKNGHLFTNAYTPSPICGAWSEGLMRFSKHENTWQVYSPLPEQT